MGWVRLVGSLNYRPLCKRALEKRRYSAKEACNLQEPTDCRHSITCNFTQWVRKILSHVLLVKCRKLFGMTNSTVRHDSFMCVTWLTSVAVIGHDLFMCVTWLIHMCDMTHSNVWHDSFTCVTWHVHMCDMTHSCVWHDAFYVPRLMHMCDMTHSYVWHDSFISVTW